MAYVDSINKNNSPTYNTLLAFGHTFINTQNASDAKTINFPKGYDVTDTNSTMSMAFKVVFVNGHTSTSTQFTINNIVVVVNKNGTLNPITYSSSYLTTFYFLRANTCLELYYTSNYDGNNTPAYVIVGNPIVYVNTNTNETFYADGTKIINSVTNGNTNAVTSGAVYSAIDNEATARGTAITNAINALDVSSVGGAGKYIQDISETDGKISATVQTMDTSPTTSSTKACTSGGIKSYVDTSLTNYYANKISSTDSGVNGAIWVN